MSKFGIVVDSSCDLLSSEVQIEGIDFSIIPLSIIVGQKEFVDDDSINVTSMLDEISKFKGASKTACPSPGDFMEAYKKSDEVFCFTMTSALSGINNSANLAKAQLLEENDSRKVHVFDTKSTAGQMILCIDKTVECIQAGMSFDDIVEHVAAYNKTLQVVFTLGSYENLIKTGRMSNFAGAIASTLNIRAVCRGNAEGEIQIVKKTRGQKAAYATLVELMVEHKSLDNCTIYISHCDNAEAAQTIKEMIVKQNNTVKVMIRECKGLTAFYTMKKGVIIAC